MASESLVTDQSINQQAKEIEVGELSKNVDFEEIIFQPKEAAGKEEADNSKEEGLKVMASTASVSEEKLETLSDLTKKDMKHEKVGETEISLEESEVSNSLEPAVEANGGNLNSRADDAHEMSSEAPEKPIDFAETSASQKPMISESKMEDLKDTEIKPTSENERNPDEAANIESSKEKVYINLIKTEDSKDENQVLDPAEISAIIVPDNSGVPDKIDFNLGNATSIEVPIKDLEVESGSPEEQKSKESTETKEPNSNVSTINSGKEDFGSSSYEVKPSEDAEAVDYKDDDLEVETKQASAKIQEDPKAETEIESDENVFQGVEVKKDDEIVEGGTETSTVPVDIPSLAEISSEEAKASEPGVVVEEETSLESDNIDTMPKVTEVLLDCRNVLEGDELVGKEKVVNAEAVQRDLVVTITDPTESEVSSVEVQSPTSTEIVDEALEVTSKEFNIAPEAIGAFSEGDKISAGDLKSECLEGESAKLMEAWTDITTEDPIDQGIEEKKIESSVSEIQFPSRDKLAEKEDVNDEAKEINLLGQTDGAHETRSVLQSDVAEISASQEHAFPESKTEDLKDAEIKVTSENDRKSEEAPLVSTSTVISKDGNVEDETQESANKESSKDKVDIKLIKKEDLKDELQVLVPAEIPGTVVVPDASETPEKNDINSSNPTSIEVPVENLEVEPGSPEEQKSNEKTETKELSSNVSTVTAGGEVVGFPSNETKPSGDSEVIEKNDISAVETLQTSAEIHEDLDAKPDLAQTQSDENVSVGVEVNRNDEIAERSIETPTVPEDIPLANVSYEEEEASEPGVVVGEVKNSLEGNNIDTVPKMADVSFEDTHVLEGDKLVDTSAEAVERDLVDTITNPGEAEVSFGQVKAPSTIEIVNEALEVTSKEFDTAPEVSEVTAPEVSEVTAPEASEVTSEGVEKSGNLKGEAAISVEAPKDISLDSVIEVKKIDSPLSERQAPDDDKLFDKEKNVNEEAKEIHLQSQADGAYESPGVVPNDFAETSTSQDIVFSELKNEDLEDTVIKPASENERKQEEKPLVSTGVDISEENNFMAEAHEVANPDSFKDEVDIKSIEPEDSKDEIQVLIPDELPTVVVPDASETFKENDVDLSNLNSIETPMNPETEYGFLDEKKLKESTETNEESSNVTTIDARGEVVGSSSFKVKPSEDAETVEKKDDGFESETVQTSVKIQEDLDAKPELGQTHSDENVSQGIEAKNDDEVAEGGIATSTVLDVSPLVKVLSEDEKTVEPSVMAVKESDNIDTVPLVADFLSDGLDGDKLVEKELVNVEAERDLTDTYTDPTKAEISSDQVEPLRTTEIVNEALELASHDLIVAPEANEVPAEVAKISAGDEEKSEATLMEAPKDITKVKDSLDQLSKEKNNEILVSEMAAMTEDNESDKDKILNVEDEERDLINASIDFSAVEVSSELMNSPEIVKESDPQALEQTSKELNIAPEVSEVPSVDDKFTASEEKSVSSKGEAGTSVVNEEAKEIHLQSQADGADGADGADETPGVVLSDFAETSTSQDIVFSELKNEDLEETVIKPASENERKQEEKPLVSTGVDISEENNFMAEAHEVANPESFKDEVDIKSIEPEDSKDEIQVLIPDELPTVVVPDASETFKENAVDLSNLNSIETPMNPEIESGFLDEKKLKENTETNESSSNVTAIDAGGEVVGSSSYEVKPLEDAKTVEKNDDGLESETVQTSVKIQEDLDAKPELGQTHSDEKFSQGIEAKNDDEVAEGGIATSTVLDVPPLVKVLSQDEKTAEPSLMVVKESDNIDTVPLVADFFSDGLDGDKFVEKELVNIEAERDLMDTCADPTKAEISSDQVEPLKTTEIVDEALELTSHDLIVAPEANEVPAEVAKISAGDEEKSEATLIEEPKDITTVKDSLDQLSKEKNNEILVSEMAALTKDNESGKEKILNVEDEERDLINASTDDSAVEVSSELMNSPEIVEESDIQALEQPSKELGIAPEVSEVPFVDDKFTAGEEKSVSSKGEAGTSVEGPKDITIAEESLRQVIEEEKNETSIGDKSLDREKYMKKEAGEIDLIIKEEGNDQSSKVISNELNNASESSEIPSKGDEVSAGDEAKRVGLESEDETLVEGPKYITIAEEPPAQVLEKSDSSICEKEMPQDNFVEKEKYVIEEAERGDLVDASTNLTAAEMSSDQAKASETAEIINEESNKQDVDETSKELIFSSEVPEIHSRGDDVSAVDEEKRGGLESEDAILEEAPKDNINVEESAGPVPEKTQSSVSEKESLPEDKLVEKEKNVNEEAEERDLVGTSAHPTAAEVSSNQVKSSETTEIVKEESNEQAVEDTSKKLDVASEASEITSKGDEFSAVDEEKREVLESKDAILVEAQKDITIAEESLDPVSEKIESSVSEKEAVPEDKLVDMEKNVNEEAEEGDLVGTFAHPTSGEVYSNKLKSSETVEIVKEESYKQALEETSKELNIASEASEIPSKGDKVSAGDDEKREYLESEDSTAMEASKDITIAEEFLDHVIEKSESSVSVKEALPEDKLTDKEKNVNDGSEESHLVYTTTDSIVGEVYCDQLNALESAEITEERNKQALEETSKEPNIAFEGSDVPSEGDKVSAGDEEKRDSLNGDGDATLMDASKDIIIVEESLEQVIEKESEKEGLPENKLVDKDKNVNEEAEERVFVKAYTDPTAADVSSDQVQASETAEIIKEESNKQASEERSKEFNIAFDAGDVPSKGDEFSAADEMKRESLEGENATIVVAPKDIIIAEDSPDQGIEKKSENSTSENDQLVHGERNVNEEDEERELVDTSLYPTIAEVSSTQVQASENADNLEASNKQALEIASKEINIAPESSDVPTDIDKVFSGGEEHNESMKVEVAASSEPPNTIAENKSEISKSEAEVQIETSRDFDSSKLFPEAVKEIIASETVEEKQDETSNDLSMEEKKAEDSVDINEEVQIIDKSENEELVAVNSENEKAKDQDLIVSSDSRDAKLTKEVSKRESNIFSKVKRTIVKAKKAILRKSPGPKSVSSEAKN